VDLTVPSARRLSVRQVMFPELEEERMQLVALAIRERSEKVVLEPARECP